MWPLLREGLRVYRPVLLMAWVSTTIGIAAVFAVLVASGAIRLGDAPRWAAASWPFYLLIASAVAGWIAIGAELSEQRLRLHLLLPFTVEQTAVARLLLPAALLLAGLVLAHAATWVVRAVAASPRAWIGHGGLNVAAVYLLFFLLLTFAVQEVTALGRTSRWKGALGVLVLVLLGAAVIALGLPAVHALLRPAAVLAVAVFTAVMTLILLRRRSELFR